MISVVIPTFNRPEGLKRAVMSVFGQSLVPEGFELVIVDNTPEATAAEAIAELRRVCPETITLIALHEPAAGVANARNTAMASVDASLVAFLDDDQSAPDTWLETLLANYRKFPAAVTFGPVETALPKQQKRHQAYFETFFAREPDLSSGFTEDSFGCGNALIDFAQIPGGAPWFDISMNEIGGEDDLLFQRVRRAKLRFAWAAEAPVWEHPPAERVSLRYTLKRAFSYGQAPITLARRQGRNRYDLVALWMAIGAAKSVWHGIQWVALSLIRHPGRAFQLDRAVRGISKVFWWIDLRFYGAAMLKPKTSKSGPVASSAFVPEAEQV
ncbi:MAG: glycosyltransferase family A protein [Pseudomonadota bacterium]